SAVGFGARHVALSLARLEIVQEDQVLLAGDRKARDEQIGQRENLPRRAVERSAVAAVDEGPRRHLNQLGVDLEKSRGEIDVVAAIEVHVEANLVFALGGQHEQVAASWEGALRETAGHLQPLFGNQPLAALDDSPALHAR